MAFEAWLDNDEIRKMPFPSQSQDTIYIDKKMMLDKK